MKEELTIRLNVKSNLFITIFASVGLSLVFIVSAILNVIDPYPDSTLFDHLILWICSFIALVLPFLIFLLLYRFHKVYLHIDEEKIIKRRKNKIYFEIKREDMKSIQYQRHKWWFITNIFAMQLLIEKKNVTKPKPMFNDLYHHANMSFKDALKIKEQYYPDLIIV